MSLSRAFTTRRLRAGNDSNESPKMPQRSKTTKGADSIRNKISAPVQLIHTTNMLSYNAPDIQRPSRSNSTATSGSGSDSGFHTAAESTPPTSPDVGSDERTPSPEPNHLSCYFKNSTPLAQEESTEAPAIPQRSPSHTKKNSYDAIARQRSISRMSRDSERSMSFKLGQPFSRPPSTSTRASSASHASSPTSTKQNTTAPPPPPPAPVLSLTTKDSHPFGQELAQVTELAEEYSTTSSPLDTIDEEQQYLETRGLKKWSADDYLSAIQVLSTSFFPDRNHAVQAPPLWI